MIVIKETKAFFIVGRCYGSYNSFEHVAHSSNKYSIRVRDIYSKASMARSLGLYPRDEFDIDIFRMFSLKKTNMVKASIGQIWFQYYTF